MFNLIIIHTNKVQFLFNSIIVEKIDTNKDEFVDLNELKTWIQFTQRRYIEDDVQRQWKQHNPENKDQIHWNTYRNNVYAFMDDMDPKDLDREDEGFTYKSMLTRDRRRWSVADRNGDDELTLKEFTDFLHPEESDYMRDIVVTETLEDIDKNHDGKVAVDEYIGDMYRGGEEGEEEPQWVKHERETFEKFRYLWRKPLYIIIFETYFFSPFHRDKNKDGFMDHDEVKDWIIPADFDHAEAESRHLIYEADSDADEKLTKNEILEKYDLFVGSQATDFGEALIRHDEF